MKVTKFIREYVTEEVNRIYNAKKNPFKEEYKACEETVNKFRDALVEEIKARVQAFADENGCTRWDGKPYIADGAVSGLSLGSMRTKCEKDYFDWERANEKAKQDKIREILISLELGATKSELTDMIAALTVEG